MAGAARRDTVAVVHPVVVFAAAGFAAIFASYGGVVADRGWRASVSGRSHCVCGRQLAGWENVPVLSWVILRGRARCCRAPIPRAYVASEALAVILGATLGALGGVIGVALAPIAGLVVALIACRARP